MYILGSFNIKSTTASAQAFGEYNRLRLEYLLLPLNTEGVRSNSLVITLLKPLNANPKKWSNTLKQLNGKLLTNCLSVFNHFVGLALEGLILSHLINMQLTLNVIEGYRIVCLTETQLQQSLNSQRTPTLTDFDIICNNNKDRFQSLAICSILYLCILKSIGHHW